MNKELKYFAYCRKSSEDTKRQVASVEDQVNALSKLTDSQGIKLVKIFREERSAKDPGRPIFDDMLNRIVQGEADAIVCWDIDRLSRNPIDNGRLQWILQKAVIKVISTPGREYYPEDAGLLMSIEGGRATDFVMRLSKNVKRGLHGKVAKGWRPSGAPIGYMNVGEEGNKTIVKDPEKFDLVRNMWDLLLTGINTPSQIRKIANEKWGLRTRVRRKLGGKKLSMSHIYEIFNDPFYYGWFWWTDEDTGERKLFKGSHPAMITEKEFARARALLGKKGTQQPKTREFPFTGVITCGECGLNITAEAKQQIICDCKNKFSSINTTTCPKCGKDSSEMNKPKILDYVYYHCTWKHRTCKQKSIELKELEKQFNKILDDIKIDDDYLQLALDYLKDKQKESGHQEKLKRASVQALYDSCQARLKRLELEYTSPQNINHEIFTSEEYVNAKRAVMAEREAIKVEAGKVEGDFDRSINQSVRAFNFCVLAKKVFNGDDLKKKRTIFSTIGSNLTLKDQKLSIHKLHPYLLIENELREQKKLLEALEPNNDGYTEKEKEAFASSIPSWLRV